MNAASALFKSASHAKMYSTLIGAAITKKMSINSPVSPFALSTDLHAVLNMATEYLPRNS